MGDSTGSTRAPIGAILAFVGGVLLAVPSVTTPPEMQSVLGSPAMPSVTTRPAMPTTPPTDPRGGDPPG